MRSYVVGRPIPAGAGRFLGWEFLHLLQGRAKSGQNKGAPDAEARYKNEGPLPIGTQNRIRTRTMHTTAQLDSLEQKRSASLIFRIEQLLPSSTTATTSTTEASLATPTTSTAVSPAKKMRSNPRPGVYTSQYTPKDTCSNAVPTAALLSAPATPTDSGRSHCQLSNGELILSASLLRQIKLSEDVYSFNAIFELHGGQVRVRLVRDVARDDEIVAWFGEELVLLMGIPFLTPLNIQGMYRSSSDLYEEQATNVLFY